MKKKNCFFLISLMSIYCLFFTGCSSEVLEISTQQDRLEFTPNEPFEQQTNVIEEAAKRMDKFVICKEGKFVISSCNHESLGISLEVYNYMLFLMEIQNMKLESTDNLYQTENNSFASYSHLYTFPTLRTGGPETTDGGINDCVVEHRWHATYVYVYISNGTLRNGGYLLAAASSIAAGVPDTTASKAVAATCGLASIACQKLSHDYPNGIIISIYIVGHIGPCIPYNITGQ